MAIKTNERPGTRAVLRHCRMSATKAREVLDLIRGQDYQSAAEALEYTERAAGTVIAKLLHSAAANAEHNDGLDPTELYVATCYADEGETLKRWRPRARGRASRIRKRSCHITVILARMPDDRLARRRARVAAELSDRRARRVAGTRRRQAEVDAGTSGSAAPDTEELESTELLDADAIEAEATEVDSTEVESTEVESTEVDSDDTEVELAEDTPAAEKNEEPTAEVDETPDAGEPEQEDR